MRVAFDPPAGLVSDDTIYSVPGSWASGTNMRPHQGRMETIGGWEAAFVTILTGVCRNAHNWTNAAGVVNIAFGTHSGLQVYDGGIVATITPSGLAAGAIDTSGAGPGYGSGTYGSGTYSTPFTAYILRTWSLDTWGETLLGVPRGGTLYQWNNNTSVVAQQITQAPDNITCMLVTPERQVLALGCNEEISNDFNGLCIRGCDIEDLTDWTTSSSNNAFEHILEGGGMILTGKLVGPVVGVWTDNGLHQGTFLGNPDQTYRFDRVGVNCGTIGPNAVTVHNGVAYWVGRDRKFRAWTPGTRPIILECPIWDDFAENLHSSQAAKIVAVGNSRFDEVWFFYPDARDGNENSRFIAFAITAMEGLKWFRGDVGRTAACDAGVLSHPLAVTVDGHVYYHELGSDADGDELAWTIRSAAQYLDEAQRVLQVQRVRSDFKDQEETVSLTAYVRSHPQAPASTKGPFALPAGAEKKDLRFSGAIVELEFSGSNHARFGKPTFDALVTGQR
jgi:hypothetical protein